MWGNQRPLLVPEYDEGNQLRTKKSHLSESVDLSDRAC